METEEKISIQIKHIVKLVRSVHLRRELKAIESDPALNFWGLIYNGLYDLSVLEWCKLFGSNGEPSHWKEVVKDHASF